jgi:assimilatory nitrate reductase catalytic subunit
MGRYRAAQLIDGRLEGCLFATSKDGQLPPRDWLEGLLEAGVLNEEERVSLLVGQASGGGAERGNVVCACFGVGVNDIVEAIQRNDLESVEAIGAMLKAGTNCGSCIPELKALLARARKQAAA